MCGPIKNEAELRKTSLTSASYMSRCRTNSKVERQNHIFAIDEAHRASRRSKRRLACRALFICGFGHTSCLLCPPTSRVRSLSAPVTPRLPLSSPPHSDHMIPSPCPSSSFNHVQLRLLVNDCSEVASGKRDRWNEPGAWDAVLKDIRRLKWLDEKVFELALDRRVSSIDN